MSSCVNVPSPDQSDVSISEGMMNRHEAAQHRIAMRLAQALLFEHANHRFSAGILSDRRRDVSIRVRIPMQNPSERTADDGQIREVRGTDETVRGTVEIQRQQLATRP